MKRSIGVAFVFSLLIFLFKMKVFSGLGYSLDLFMQTQVATSWMDGRPFHDNYYGNHLGTHSYLLLPVLGLIAGPLGSPGLLLVLAASGGLALHFAHGILMHLDLPHRAAIFFAVLLVAAPFSIHTLHDWQYGFHVELLEPAIALGLFYALLRDKLKPSLAWGALLISVKEDAPFLAAIVAIIVLVETFLARHREGVRGSGLLHGPACAVLVLSSVSFPILLLLIKWNASGATQGGAMTRLPLAFDAGVRDYGGLARFLVAHSFDFLFSHQVRVLLVSLVCASFGALLLRPHFIPLLLPFALVAWLQSDDPLWASRFAPALAAGWCITLLGIASFWHRTSSRMRHPPTRAKGTTLAFAGILAVALTTAMSLSPAAAALDFYTFTPWTYYTAEERADADELFARYREEGKRAEPVIAHIYLFRYAHDRNLFWFYSVPDGFQPKWILWDDRAPAFAKWGYAPIDYECLGRKGRFGLYRLAASD